MQEAGKRVRGFTMEDPIKNKIMSSQWDPEINGEITVKILKIRN